MSFSLALLFQADDPSRARGHAETAARLFGAIGRAEYAARAERPLHELGG